jgi:hypothetical protein
MNLGGAEQSSFFDRREALDISIIEVVTQSRQSKSYFAEGKTRLISWPTYFEPPLDYGFVGFEAW